MPCYELLSLLKPPQPVYLYQGLLRHIVSKNYWRDRRQESCSCTLALKEYAVEVHYYMCNF